MPDHLKSLVVILVLSTAAFLVMRRPISESLIAPDDFARRRNLWYGITLACFLTHNFWIFVVVTTALLIFAQLREPNRLALFTFLVFVVPGFNAPIPGFGLIQQLFSLGHVRLMTLVVLVPAFFALHSNPDRLPFGRSTADKFLIAYILLQVAFNIVLNSFTMILRNTFLLWLDVIVPYYVASRAIQDMRGFKDTLGSLVVAALLMVPLAVFETLKHWLLYSSVDNALGLNWVMGTYLSRGEALRATVTAGHALVLSFVMVVTMGLYLFVAGMLRSTGLRMLGWLGVTAGLVVPLGRGAWVAAGVAMFVAAVLGEQPMRRIGQALLVAVIAGPALLLSPWGGAIIDHLPFVGTVDASTVVYRQRLIEVSLGILAQNPLLGVYDYMDNYAMEEMRQGEGIIDMVNSYLGVAMSSGLVGLTLFSGVFAASAFGLWRAWRLTPYGSEARLLGRALLAAMAAAAVTIATVSFIVLIPTLWYLLAGFGVAYARMVTYHGLAEDSPVSPADPEGYPAMPPGRPFAASRRMT